MTMSLSLNHLAPTDQSPILPDGSFGEQIDIGTNVSQILSLIPEQWIEDLGTQLTLVNQSADHLCEAAQEYLGTQSAYNFRDYALRLQLPSKEVLRILEEEIFRQNNVLTDLWKAFYEYVDSIQNLDPNFRERFKLKVVQDLNLDNLVYQRTGDISSSYLVDIWDKHQEICCKDVAQFCSKIRSARTTWITSLTLNYTGISQLTTQELQEHIQIASQWIVPLHYVDIAYPGLHCAQAIELLHVAREANITLLMLPTESFLLDSEQKDIQNFFKELENLNRTGGNLDLSDSDSEIYRDPKLLMKIVKMAGNAGVGDIDFSGIFFWGSIQSNIDYWAKITKVSGDSGIKSITMGKTEIYETTDIRDAMCLISVAGHSGIKRFNFRLSGLEDILDTKTAEILLKCAGDSGILDFCLSLHGDYDHDSWAREWIASDITEMIRTAWISGIKSLELHMHKCGIGFSDDDGMLLLAIMADTGMKNLEVNDLRLVNFATHVEQKMCAFAQTNNIRLILDGRAWSYHVYE